MAAAPADFEKDLNRFTRKTDELLEEVFVETAKEVRDKVAEKTPIDTGRHSASWNASVNAPNYHAKPESYNNPTGAPKDGEVDLEGFKLGQTLYVANGAPVIALLNAGWSQQAPAGFIEGVAAEIKNMIPLQIARLRGKYGL